VAVTRNDVARRAGVSSAVVSYVVNSGPRPVSADARRRVLEAIDELGYRPDGRARSLRLGRSHVIGIVLPDTTNPFFAEMAQAVEDAAYAGGYAVLVCTTSDDIERERTHIVNLASRRVDGLILMTARADQDLSEVIGLGIPVVAMDRSPDDSPVSTIRVDNASGARLGTQHLIEHGYQRIAIVAGPSAAGVSRARVKGFRRAMSTAGLIPGPVIEASFNFEGGHHAAHELLSTPEHPDAVVVSSDVQAIGVLSAAANRGVRVPEDLAVVSFDGTRAGAFAVPALTSVAQPTTAMAERAFELLRGEGDELLHLALKPKLIRRRSCGCPGE
jgi:LacI family transcriptional regulator